MAKYKDTFNGTEFIDSLNEWKVPSLPFNKWPQKLRVKYTKEIEEMVENLNANQNASDAPRRADGDVVTWHVDFFRDNGMPYAASNMTYEDEGEEFALDRKSTATPLADREARNLKTWVKEGYLAEDFSALQLVAIVVAGVLTAIPVGWVIVQLGKLGFNLSAKAVDNFTYFLETARREARSKERAASVKKLVEEIGTYQDGIFLSTGFWELGPGEREEEINRSKLSSSAKSLLKGKKGQSGEISRLRKGEHEYQQ